MTMKNKIGKEYECKGELWLEGGFGVAKGDVGV